MHSKAVLARHYLSGRGFALILLLTIPLCAVSMPVFRVFATDLAPFSQEKGEFAPGALTEIVEALSQRVQAPLKVGFVPWQRAVLLPTRMQRTAVLPLTRTPEREAQYRWLVRLYKQNFVFMGLANGADVNHLDQLRPQKVAVLRGSPHLKTLKDEGFTQIIEVEDVRNAIRMLQAGMVNAVYGGEAIHRASASSAGYAESDFIYGMTLRSGEIWLGGSLDFTDSDIAQLQQALDAMQKDGSYARILRKYGLSPIQ